MPDDDARDTIVDPERTRLGVGSVPIAKPTTRSLVGEIVSGCLVESELGRGAMGVVYRGTHVESGRTVAIKALHPHHVDNPKLVARFQREAKLAARLKHPHIAGVVDIGGALDDGRHLIVLEFVEGKSLGKVLEELGGPMPATRVVPIVAQILEGLEHVHAAKLIHRDLKPENVIVAEDDFVRIVDIGIAVLRDPDANIERLTATGQLIGTPTYMSPEQAMCEPFDHRVDLFALGVMVYEMLAGARPFDGESAIDIAIANVKKDPPPIARRAAACHGLDLEVDPLYEAFARKLMAKQRDHRFANARDAADVLALIERDRAAAGLRLGITDVERALAVVALGQPRDS